MKSYKVSALIILLLLIVPALCFCDDITSSAECVLMFLPKNIVNNSALGIELSEAKELETTDFSTPLTFSSESRENLSLFRLYSTLKSKFATIYSYSDFNRYYTTTANENTENSTRVRIYTTGIFSYEDDPTIVRDFKLETFFTKATINNNGSSYEKDSGYPIKMTLGQTYALEGEATTYFKNIGGSNYEIYIPSSPMVGFSSGNNYRCYVMYMRLYDIGIVLENDVEGLPSGYYTTTITVESDVYENRKYTTKDGSTVYYTPTSMQITETFTVRGYIETTPSGTTCVLSVTSAADTYSMDLGLSSSTGSNKYYDIANISLYDFNINTNIPDVTRASRYTVYISPDDNYMSSTGNYYFYKKNTQAAVRTDVNTIYYDLYINDGAYKNFSNSNTYTTTTEFGGAGVYSGSGTGNVYYVMPKYSYTTNTFANSSNDTYYETWKLNAELYLKIADSSLAAATYHSPGEYYSDIYFTLVAD